MCLRAGLTIGFMLSIGSVCSLFGQTTTTIQGIVQDAQGVVLPGVTIIVENPGLTRSTVTVLTDDQGRYHIPGLQAATYVLRAQLEGFSTQVLPDIVVSLGSVVGVDVTMRVTGIQEEITVTAQIAPIRTGQSDIAQTIVTQTIDSLPLNGRQFLDLLKLAPGVAPRPESSTQGADATVFGERSIANSFLVDGFDNNDLATRQFAEFFPQDAIQEFNVMLANYQAEFGRAQGAVTNIITRSGANDFHGRVFGFFRDDALDSSNVEGQDVPALNRQEVGGTIGGPIVREKTFFFNSFQFFREERGLNFDTSNIPPIVLDGFFTPALPEGEPFELIGLNKRYTNFLKVDHQINDNNQLAVSFNLNRETAENLLTGRSASSPPPSTVFLPSSASDFENNTTSVNGHYTSFFSPKTFLESRFRYADLSFKENVETPDSADVIQPVTFSLGVQIFAGNAPSTGRVDRAQDRFQWSEQFSHYQDAGDWGTHSFKLGVDLDRTKIDQSVLPTTAASEFVFVVIGNTALEPNDRYKELGFKTPALARQDVIFGNDRAVASTNNWAFYTQDSWDVTPRLTLNLGLRYDWASLLGDDKNNFAPRIGVAYDIGGNRQTIIRSSWGRFYDPSIIDTVTFTPGLGGVQFGDTSLQIIPLGGSYFRNPAVGAFGPLQDGGIRWLANPEFYSFIIPQDTVRTSGNISITGKGQPFIIYELLGIPVPDPMNPPALTFNSISGLTGGSLTPEEALGIINSAFPGNLAEPCDQFVFLPSQPPGSIFEDRPLTFKFRDCQPQINAIQVLDEERLPHTDSFNIGVEQALGPDISLDAQLVIRNSRNLLTRRISNLLETPVGASCSANTTDGGPCIRALETLGFLDTTAFTLAVRKRFSANHSFLLSYTYTDATDNFSTLRVPPEGAQTSFLFSNEPELDDGRSLNTPEHVFAFSGTADLPFGIGLSGLLNVLSGRPFNGAGLPIDSDGDDVFDNRDLRTEKGEFETDATINVDLRLAKEFSVGDNLRVQGLIEFFNLFNRANPLIVNRNVGPELGENIRPLPGREIQLGFRIDF